jgi:uncharacterized protein
VPEEEVQEMAQGNYSHIEIPADDPKRAAGFYKAVFGWKFETIPGFENYELYQTPAGREGIGGGIGKRGETAGKEIRNYIDVASIDDAVAKVKQHGGRVVQPKAEVMGQGWYAVVTDTEGNEFAVWEDDPNARRG